MRLRRIEVQDFRKLAGHWLVDGLPDGITVIGGDNEEGKSTLLEAVKAGLLEHHRVGGQTREAMTGHGGATPRVALAFETAGTLFKLDKEFGRRCELAWPGGRLAGDEAEERLAELLRFERRQGRAERRPEHQGLLSLFWVEQGTSFLAEAATAALEAQQERIAALVRAEIGEVAAGPALARLRERALAQLTRFWTPKGQLRRGGELERAQAELAALEREAAALREARRRYDEAVDRLARAREERDRLEAADRLARAQDRQARAGAELADIERLEGERDRLADRLKAAVAEARRLEDERAGRERRRQEAATLEAELRQVEEEAATLAETLAAAEARLQAAERREAERIEAEVAARRRLLLGREARELAALSQQIERTRALVEESQELGRALAEKKAELAGLRVDRAALEALRRAAATVDRQRDALAAVATLVEPHPEPGRRAMRGAEELAPGRQHRLIERTELRLEGFGTLTILPGGGDLAERRQALARAEAELAAALAAHGLSSLAEAETAAARREGLEAELGRLEERLRTLLRGAEVGDRAALEEQLRIQERRLRDRRAALGGDVEPPAGPEAIAGLDEAQRAAAAAVETARRDTREALEAVSRARARSAELDGRRRQLARQAAAAREAVLRDEASLADETLARELESARTSVRELEAQRALVQGELERRDAEGVRLRLAQARREIEELAAERERLRREVDRLEGEVRGLGVDACDSRLEELLPQREALARRAAATSREAQAWKLLADELRTVEQELQEQLVEPVRKRLAPLLRRLWPDAEALLDPASLAPRGLRRSGVAEPLAALSVGTREQLAILVRLALGELLIEREGEAPCLILDDALVFSDEGRLERMKAILERAGERQQILLLTCRPRDYLGLPGRRVRLEGCRQPG